MTDSPKKPYRTIEEREIKPDVPTTLTVEVLEADNATVKTTFELGLHSVRDGFAFPVEDGEHYNGPFCLDGGWHNCYHDGGVRLAQASLQFCLDLADTKKPV